MEWYNILTMILGALGTVGGVSGAISIYHAKSKKQTIDVANFQTMLNEAQEMYKDARKDTKELQEEFSTYKKESSKYVAEFKERFAKLEKRVRKGERAIARAYRCPFPEDIKDCPVLLEYNKSNCDTCIESSEHTDENLTAE